MHSVRQSAIRKGLESTSAGYGGHFRAVQGFRYLGDADGTALSEKAKVGAK
jgi:hypothetical protein